jgi:hypothetical protein
MEILPHLYVHRTPLSWFNKLRLRGREFFLPNVIVTGSLRTSCLCVKVVWEKSVGLPYYLHSLLCFIFTISFHVDPRLHTCFGNSSCGKSGELA